MTNSIFDRFSSTDTASIQRKQKQGRILCIEELENRELLSATLWETGLPVVDTDTQVIVSSASASVMSAASVPIPAVTGLTATDRTHQSITVEWNEVSDTAAYELRYSIHDPWSSRREWTVVSDITDTTFIVNGLQSRTSYEIQVRAVAEGTFSNWRFVIAHTTHFVPTPTDLSVSVGEMTNHIFGRSATVTWNAGEGSTSPTWTAYVVECREYGTDVWESHSVGASTFAMTWTSFMPGTTYEFRVRAVGVDRTSEWSDSVWITTPTTAHRRQLRRVGAVQS